MEQDWICLLEKKVCCFKNHGFDHSESLVSAPAQAASPAKEASSASKTSKVVVISQHREEFLAPGSVE